MIRIAIQYPGNGKWVSADQRQAGVPLIASSDTVGPWEQFDVDPRPGGFGLRASNGFFVLVTPSGRLDAEGSDGSTFEIVNPADPSAHGFALNAPITIKAGDRYVTASENGVNPLKATAQKVGPWETFSAVLGAKAQWIDHKTDGESLTGTPPATVGVQGVDRSLMSQWWRLQAQGADGTYAVLHQPSGAALDGDGARVSLQAPNGGDSQRWRVRVNEDGWCTLTQKATGNVLDANGSSVYMGASNGGDFQRWMPRRAGLISDDVFKALLVGDDHDCPTGYSPRRFAAWMSFLSDDVRLIDVAIPGSHDSATSSLDDSFMNAAIGNVGGAMTQGFNLLAQLLWGIRFFDLRVKRSGNDIVVHHGIAVGARFDDVVTHQLTPFFEHVASEVVVLDMDMDSGCEADTLAILRRHLAPDILAATEFVKSGHFDPAVTLGDLRRKGRRLVVLWQHDRAADWQIDRDAYRWSPYEDDPFMKSVARIPPWLNDRMKEWKRDKFFIAQAISSPFLWSFVPGDHPSQIERRDSGELNGWVLGLTGASNVNIIIRDFVDNYHYVVAKIIGLNADRGHVAPAFVDRFKRMLDLNDSLAGVDHSFLVGNDV